MDALTIQDVIFDPYIHLKKDKFGEEIDHHVFSSLDSYNGPLFHPHGYVMSNPRRVLSQYGYVQEKVTHESFKLLDNASFVKSANVVLNYSPELSIDVWNDRNNAQYQIHINELIPILVTKKAEEGYLEWYYHFGHPHVINNDPEAAVYIQKAQEKKMRETENKSVFDMYWKALYFKTKNKCLHLAQTLTPCVKKGEALTSAQVKVLQQQIKDLPDPNKDYENLERGTKRSRDVGTSQRRPSPSSSGTNEEDMHAHGRGRGRGHSGRDGPRTRGGNKSNKRGRGRDRTRNE